MADAPFELLTFESMNEAHKGAIMDGLRRGHEQRQVARLQLIQAQCQRAMEAVAILQRQVRRDAVLRPESAIPPAVLAAWRAKFVLDDRAANVGHTTGDECWKDRGRDGFVTWYKKHNPEFFFKEEKRGNQIMHPGWNEESRKGRSDGLVLAGKYAALPGKEGA